MFRIRSITKNVSSLKWTPQMGWLKTATRPEQAAFLQSQRYLHCSSRNNEASSEAPKHFKRIKKLMVANRG